MTDPVTVLAAALADRYRIERELGAGGMATVYLAHDVRHDRKVALKVLRPELGAVIGADRFLKEIKVTANLQHPHILGLIDSGEVDSLLYYVMPYVEGESLRDRLTREKQLPISDAVRIATEVAGALDYAHRHGVIHRDIKPENVLLHDGRALVADFGIALAAAKTGQDRLTETGISLGTPQYMSPEQAMGERVLDGRTDIYALGCVLYEMLSGEAPFAGPTVQAILARVMTERPRPLVTLRHTIPPSVEAAVMTALEKLSADRFATAQEFVAALRNPNYTGSTTSLAFSIATPWKRRALVGWGVAVAAIVLALWMGNRPRPSSPVTRVGLSFPASQSPVGWGMALTPDGSRLLYYGPPEQGRQIWVKPRDSYEAAPLEGTAEATDLAISPDGEWVAFVQGQQLKKIPILGGEAITLDSAWFGGTSWLDDGSLIYHGQLGAGGLRRLSAKGGPPTIVLGRDSLWMRALTTPLPRARGILFTRCSSRYCNPPRELWVFDFRSGQERRLLSGVLRGWYLPTGHLAFVREDGRMYAAPFHLDRLELRGNPVPVLDGIATALGIAPQVAISSSGDLVMQTSGSAGLTHKFFQMMEVDRTGRSSPVDTSWNFNLGQFDAGGVRGWTLAPDGRSLAIGLYTQTGNDIWVKQLPRGPASRLTTDERSEYSPRWTADGQWVTYIHSPGPMRAELWRRRADGTGAEERILNWSGNIRDMVMARDGRWLILRTGENDGERDLLALERGVDTIPHPLLANPRIDEAAPALSPDGHWLAYLSTETGRREVYIRPFPNTDAGKWQVSSGGGKGPLWAHSGRELFYIDGARNMVSMSVTLGPAIRLGDRQVLFRVEDSLYLSDYRTSFDITPDDRSFLMAREISRGPPAPSTFILVEHWFEELKRKMRDGRRE